MIVTPKCRSSSWLLNLQFTSNTCIPTPVLVRKCFRSHSLHRHKIGTIRHPSHMDRPFHNVIPPGGADVETAEDYPNRKRKAVPASKNAFSELMMPKVKKAPKKPAKTTTKKDVILPPVPGMYHPGNSRDGLYPYIAAPESQGRVILHDPSFVLIQDKYPKATVHLLLLPRDLEKTTLESPDRFVYRRTFPTIQYARRRRKQHSWLRKSLHDFLVPNPALKISDC